MTKMEHPSIFINAQEGTDRPGTQAILVQIYKHALHGGSFQPKNLVLMSRLQKTVRHADRNIQILYNRTMAYLSLCAFRNANIKEAHDCLADLMSDKCKEWISSGMFLDEMPYFNMHINLELLECVYLVSAMLIEIPYMAAHEFDPRRRRISKTFYQLLRSFERQSFIGPPVSMREHVVAAAKAMRNGHWAACKGFLINEIMNKKVWNFFYHSDTVKEMLTRLIKEETLRSYLFTYSYVYHSISIPILGKMFELEKSRVHSIISKMIANEELLASLDGPTQMVVIHRSKSSRLQSLALQLTVKISGLLNSNEQLLNTKQRTK